jgi:hypothetical protein
MKFLKVLEQFIRGSLTRGISIRVTVPADLGISKIKEWWRKLWAL